MQSQLRNRLIAILLLIFLGSISTAQETDASYYFDDGGIADSKRLIKTGYDFINNEIPIVFEQKLGEHFSLEFGVGTISNKRQARIYNFIENNSGFGFTSTLGLRVYFYQFYERVYTEFKGRGLFLGEETYYEAIFLGAGYQYPIHNKLLFDAYFGFGLRQYQDIEYIYGYEHDYGKTTTGVLSLEIKLAYAI